MATNKALIKAYIEHETKAKIKYIANLEKRSESNITELLIDNHIKEYERLNGELIVNDDGTVIPKGKDLGESSILKSG